MAYNSIRPSTLIMQNQMQSAIFDNRDAYNKLSSKISSGQNYLTRSENPIATNEAATIKQNVSTNAQWADNVEYADNWETVTNSYLQNILDVLHRSNEIVTEANNTINQPNGWGNLATELDTQLDSLLSNANSRYMGISIFAGTKTSDGIDPYTATRDATSNKITSIDFLAGFTDKTTTFRTIQIGEYTTSSYGALGSGNYERSVFQTNYIGDDGVKANFDTFQTLIDLRKYLDGETASIDRSLYMEGEALPADVTDKQLFDRILRRVQKGLDNVIERVVDSGSNQSKFESLDASVSAIGTAAEKRLSKLEDIDVAKAATDLSTVEASLQASLQLATKITDLSIVNYI